MPHYSFDKLLEMPKKTEASKECKRQYLSEMKQKLVDVGLSEENLDYLKVGFSFCGARPLAEYLLERSGEDRVTTVKEFLSAPIVKKNEKNWAFRMEVGLLGFFFKETPMDLASVSEVIKAITVSAKTKDGAVLKDAPKVIERYFLSFITEDTVLPTESDLQIKPGYYQDFAIIFGEAFLTITPSSYVSGRVLELARKWLSGSTPIASNEFTGEMKNTSNSVDSDNLTSAENLEEAESTPNDNRGNQNCNQVPSDNVQPTEEISVNSTTLIPMQELPMTVKRSRRMIRRIDETLQSVSACFVEFGGMVEELGEVRKQNAELSEKAEARKKAIVDLNKQVAAFEEERKTAADRIADLSEKLAEETKRADKFEKVFAAYSADDTNSQNEQIIALGKKLRSEYKEYLIASDMEMSLELGENLRDQLRAVFKILAKAGVELEG